MHSRASRADLIAAGIDENRSPLWDFADKTGLRDSEHQAVIRFDLRELEKDNPLLDVKERDEYGFVARTLRPSALDLLTELH